MPQTIADERQVVRRADLRLLTPLVAPSSEAERKLAEIWQRAFDMDTVGVRDEFYDLGGDSLLATVLAAEVEATFGVRFSPSDILDLSTIALQAERVSPDSSGEKKEVPPHVVIGKHGGSHTPLFLVHGAIGFSFFKPAFLNEVGRDRSIYLFQAPGLDKRTRPLDTVEEIAGAYVTSMRELQPTGPYNVAGICAGAIIALEMCNQLVEAGEAIQHLVLLDPGVVGAPALRPVYMAKHDPKSKTYKGLRKLLCVLSGGWSRASNSFQQDLQKREKDLRWIHESINRRKAELDDLAHGESSYSPEVMLQTSLKLNSALMMYMPRRYPGKAVMLSTTKRAPGIRGPNSFWHHYVGELDFHAWSCSHKEIFDSKILETAQFVRAILLD